MRHRCFSTNALAVVALAVLAWSVSPAAAQCWGGNGQWYGGPGGYGYGYSGIGWGWTPPYVFYGYGSPYHPTGSTTSGGDTAERRTAFYSGPMDSESANGARINVHVPPHARVFFDGATTRQPGPFRQFVSPPLEANHTYTYEIRAAWTENGGTVERTRKLEVHRGQQVNVDFLTRGGPEHDMKGGDQINAPPRPGEQPPPPKPEEDKVF